MIQTGLGPMGPGVGWWMKRLGGGDAGFRWALRFGLLSGAADRERGSAAQRAVAMLLCWFVLGVVLLNALSPSPSGRRGLPPVVGKRSVTLSHVSPRGATGSKTNKAGHGVRAVAPASASPGSIRVLVANGTTVSGAATRFTGALRTAGYHVLAPVNSTVPAMSSVVYYESGDRADALAVAQFLGAGSGSVQPLSKSPPVSKVGSAMVVVVIGPDLANQAVPSGSASTGTG